MRAVTAEDITLLLSKMIRAYYGCRYHRDQKNHSRGRDRQCGEPLLPSAYLREVDDETDPTISSPFDGIKHSRLSSGLV